MVLSKAVSRGKPSLGCLLATKKFPCLLSNQGSLSRCAEQRLESPSKYHLNSIFTDIEHLADALGSDWLIQHKNKDVRLLVACALADVLRIYAPDPPYGEETRHQLDI